MAWAISFSSISDASERARKRERKQRGKKEKKASATQDSGSAQVPAACVRALRFTPALLDLLRLLRMFRIGQLRLPM